MIGVIIGSTGLTGKKLLQHLINDKEFTHIISVSRSLIDFDTPKLTQVLLDDFSNLIALENTLKGDHYFCCLGTTIKKAKSKENFIKLDYDACLDFAKIAKFHDAKSFNIITAKGVSLDSSFFYNQVKAKLEASLLNLKLTKILFFRPGLLLGKRNESRPAEEVATIFYKLFEFILPQKFIANYVTDTNILARAMSEAFKHNVRPLNYIESNQFMDYL